MPRIRNRILFTISAAVISIIMSIPAFSFTIPQEIKEKADALELDADAAILIDATTGEILYEKNPYKKEYPASITKLMTMLLAFENCSLDETVTFSRNAVYSIEPGSSNIGIDQGEELTVEQCLYGIMLQSANEVSNGIAEHIDGSMEEFAKHMTQRAKELGAQNTNFVNANGLHDENHYTTAYDMALIAKELLKYPEFKEILGSTYYEIPPTNIQPETRYLHGQTQLIKSASSFYYEECEGGKTGFTDQARNTLVAYAKRGDTEVISVVLYSTGYGEYTDTIKLFDYGLDNFKTVNICKSGDQCGKTQAVTESFMSSSSEDLPVGYADSITVTIPAISSESNIEISHNIPTTVSTPVKEGDVIGTAQFSLNGEVIGETNLLALSNAGEQESAVPAIANGNNNKTPINIKMIGGISALAIVLLVIAKITFSKIKYEIKRKKRRERLKHYRDTNYSNITLKGNYSRKRRGRENNRLY